MSPTEPRTAACQHTETWFDRSLCPCDDGVMHDVCVACGLVVGNDAARHYAYIQGQERQHHDAAIADFLDHDLPGLLAEALHEAHFQGFLDANGEPSDGYWRDKGDASLVTDAEKVECERVIAAIRLSLADRAPAPHGADGDGG